MKRGLIIAGLVAIILVAVIVNFISINKKNSSSILTGNIISTTTGFEFISESNNSATDTTIKSGQVHIPLLYGNVGTYTGIGRSKTQKVATSNTNQLIYNATSSSESQYDGFVASWASGGAAESYYLRATISRDLDAGVNLTSFINKVTGQVVCDDSSAGQTCNLGNIVLTINRIDYFLGGDRIVNISINSIGSFNKLYNTNNYYITLPLFSDIPTNEHIINVYNLSGSIKQRYILNWSGDVVNTDSICYDSDGLSYTTFGFASKGDTVLEDTCTNSEILTERYCDSTKNINSSTYNCSIISKSCMSGICGCVPNWQAINTSCQDNERLTTWFNDTRNCGDTPLANLTFHCDYDTNGIIGNLTSLNSRTSLNLYINSSATNLSLNYLGRLNNKIEFRSGNNTIVEFDWNFTSPLDLDNIYIEKQGSSASRGYLLIKGIAANKKVLVDKLTNSTKICVRNAEISSISDLSSNCVDSGELLIDCLTILSSIPCSISGNFFQVSGLTSSAIREFVQSTTNCTPNWNCTNFTSCTNNLKSRNCTDLNNCNSSMLTKIDTQSCISITPCTPNWNCTNWTKCSKAGNQTRNCNDRNACNSTTNNRKTETQGCEPESEINLILIIIIAAIAVIIIIIILLVLYLLNKERSESSQAIPATQYGYTFPQS